MLCHLCWCMDAQALQYLSCFNGHEIYEAWKTNLPTSGCPGQSGLSEENWRGHGTMFVVAGLAVAAEQEE